MGVEECDHVGVWTKHCEAASRLASMEVDSEPLCGCFEPIFSDRFELFMC